MKTKLDHIYGANDVSSEELETLKTKVDNLSQITAKTNIGQTFTGVQKFQGGAQMLAQVYNTKDVTTKEYVDNRTTNLAKTNVANSFTPQQTFNGNIVISKIYREGTDQTIAGIKNQGAKNFIFEYEQNNYGFLNYCNITFRHRFGTNDWSNLFIISMRDPGLVLNVRSNTIDFENKTTIKNIVDKNIKDIVAASTDFNDFKTRMGNL